MNYGNVVITQERTWLRVILKFLHLIRYPWAQQLAYYEVARMVTSVNSSTGTVTIDRPFPKKVKSGQYVVYKQHPQPER